jgi:hypothetical protein
MRAEASLPVGRRASAPTFGKFVSTRSARRGEGVQLQIIQKDNTFIAHMSMITWGLFE